MMNQAFTHALSLYWQNIYIYDHSVKEVVFYAVLWIALLSGMVVLIYRSLRDMPLTFFLGLISMVSISFLCISLEKLGVGSYLFDIVVPKNMEIQRVKTIEKYNAELSRCITSCPISLVGDSDIADKSRFYHDTGVAAKEGALENFILVSGADVLDAKVQYANAQFLSFKDDGNRHLFLFFRISNPQDRSIAGVYEVPISSFMLRMTGPFPTIVSSPDGSKADFENSVKITQ